MSAPLEFETVEQCLLCGSREQHDAQGVSLKGTAFSYCYCGRCGLKYMRPRPTPAAYERFYKEAYWTEIVEGRTYPTIAAADDPRVDQMALRMPKYRRSYDVVKRDMLCHRRLHSHTRILEVGCGFGYTLEWLAQEFGCRVFGVEPGEEAIRRCAQAPAIQIVARTAEEYLIDSQPTSAAESFDVILFRHCLENMVDPISVLRGARERLTDDGELLIYTPNVEYYDIMNPYHPYIYSPETISRLLRKCGFSIVGLAASPSPTNHRAAADVVNPSYEIAVIARRGEWLDVNPPKIDPIRLAASHQLGQDATAWSKLSVQDYARRSFLRVAAKLRRRLAPPPRFQPFP